ncbi:DNA recombination protein RmuC [Paludibacter sp. 221]|uniref:DNA recombination protein RmuC n=1 Tax=Paludibacter sp. 221 TaxID=2302939 RepID=UPI0013CF7705|nr:DNA recombination protein RmuC [Paludibacter sp. 221]NDV47941.1 DNA recombination protein RmuC [Paludibacter sp. 221]
MEYILPVLLFLIGFFVAWFVFSRKQAAAHKNYEEREKELLEAKTEAEKQYMVAQETLRLKSDELLNVQKNLTEQISVANQYALETTALRTQNENLVEKLNNQKQEIEALQKRLTMEFENIAGKIMKERSDEFSVSNYKSLNEILNPLKEKIQLFEKKVDETYDKELRDKISLREEVRKLTELNTRVSEEANNLTRALKGDVKKQGNWGEVVLERVLERSGLTRGQEYEREQVVEGAASSVQRPDVIIHLPDNKHIVVDSKVSLIAYERMVSADTDELREKSLKEHIASLRSHVKLLSEKNYQNAQSLNTPDFVLMFLPIEACFSVAVQNDTDLFSYAWEKKIVIVSPTTLLATLRTIASIWKQENQTKNAQEIARLSGTLYDKFIGFAEDMAKIKTNIERASVAYDDALKKMKTGNGNIIRTAEKIKELGAKTGNKSLPASFEEMEAE